MDLEIKFLAIFCGRNFYSVCKTIIQKHMRMLQLRLELFA